MSIGLRNTNLSANPIYTLAQRGTESQLIMKPNVIVSGNGTDIKASKLLTNKAKRKVISRSMVLNLVDVAKSKGASKRAKAYWNTYYCQSILVEKDGKLFGKYCKNRFCTLCSANRKAELINKYYPVLKDWEEPYFVTLTLRSVKEKHLNQCVTKMHKVLNLTNDKYKKRHQRGKGIKLMGVRSLECNFNAVKKTYNPHFHIIVPNKETAHILKEEWLKYWTSKYTYHKPQHIRKVENMERDLIETIKYGSKIFTEPDIKKKTKRNQKSTIPPMIYANALDTIFEAFKGRRIFDRFGFNLPKQPQQVAKNKTLVSYDKWVFQSKENDWINVDTGEYLTGFQLPIETEYLLKYNVNLTLH